MNMRDKLKAKMQTALDRQKALIKAAEEAGRELSAEETTEFEQCEIDFETAEKSLSRLEKTEAAEARMKARHAADKKDVTGNIEKATEGDDRPAYGANGSDRKLTEMEKIGILAWGAAKAIHYPKHDPLEHIDDAGFQQVADWSREEKAAAIRNKTFLTTGATSGQNTVFTPLSTDFIEFLRNASAFLAGSPVSIDLSFGTLDIPAGNATTAATYATEVADSSYTEATTRKVSLSAKHLKSHTAISNYNIEVSPLAVAAILGDELAQSWVSGMDAAGLRGDGLSNSPAGLLTLINAAHKTNVTANTHNPTYTAIEADGYTALAAVAGTNIQRRRMRWIMNNRVKYYMQRMRDGNGNKVFPGLESQTPTWLEGIPVIVSEVIPSNLGVNTNESEIYLVDFGHVLLGIARALSLKASTEASYKDGSSNMQSAFSRDETVIRAVGSHDFDMRHDKAGYVLKQVKWGAAST